MRLFNAHRPSGLGHAMEPVLNNGLRGLTHQARRGGLQLDEPQTLVNIREPWRFVSVRWISSAPILGNAFSALRLYANKTNSEAPCSFSQASISAQFFCWDRGSLAFDSDT